MLGVVVVFVVLAIGVPAFALGYLTCALFAEWRKQGGSNAAPKTNPAARPKA